MEAGPRLAGSTNRRAEEMTTTVGMPVFPFMEPPQALLDAILGPLRGAHVYQLSITA